MLSVTGIQALSTAQAQLSSNPSTAGRNAVLCCKEFTWLSCVRARESRFESLGTRDLPLGAKAGGRGAPPGSAALLNSCTLKDVKQYVAMKLLQDLSLFLTVGEIGLNTE